MKGKGSRSCDFVTELNLSLSDCIEYGDAPTYSVDAVVQLNS